MFSGNVIVFYGKVNEPRKHGTYRIKTKSTVYDCISSCLLYTSIPALGEEFDPNFHNAVMTEETEEYESGKVSGVMQKGYTLNGKVIRPSMVKVVG